MDIQQFFAAPVASCIFLITIITSLMAFRDGQLKYRFMLNPPRVFQQKDWQTLFTSGLVHSDYWHLIFNMLAFYFFAFQVEMIIGHWQFAVLYILSLLTGSLPSLIRHKDDSHYYTLGASGAISGVLFAAIMINPTAKIWFLITFPGWVFALLFIGYSLYASMRGGGRINHDGHLFGAIGGVVTLILLRPMVATDFVNWVSSVL